MNDNPDDSLIDMAHARFQKQKIVNKQLQRRVTIDVLPEDVLLLIFDYYVADANKDRKYEEWQKLVHVCQNWRYVVFGSPLRLNLRILCSARTPVKEKLAVWPQLPIIIHQYTLLTSKHTNDNILAALGYSDRVLEIALAIPSSLVEIVCAAMRKTFAVLKNLRLFTTDDKAPVVSVSESFLGGSAPHLQHLWLDHIQFPFPSLRRLLFSVPNLILLYLRDIPHSGYFSPEAIVGCLSALTRLKHLYIGFKSPRSRPPSREGRHPPPTRSVLPALTELTFIGVSEYLEDLVTRIDAPLLDTLPITFFHQLTFDTPQLVQFISRTPRLNAYDKARVIFSDLRATIVLPRRDNLGLRLGISCRQSDWQLSSLAQVCTSSIPQALIPILEHLYILENRISRPLWQDDLENNQWLELFHPFTTVKNLYLSRESVSRIVPIMQELVGERVTEVLPNLQSIFLEDLQESESVSESIRHFIAARQLSSRPITISHWTIPDNWATIY